MKKSLLGLILLALAIAVPVPSMAGVDVSIGISLPPLIVFRAPPEVVVIPDTNYVYVVPDIDADMFFWNGWWWRLWEGRWYRSHYYNRGWAYYNNIPSFYYDVDPGWRGYYRDRNWYGHRWEYERIPNRQLQQNWRRWNKNRHWERQRTWDVQNYQPRPQQQIQELRQQRREQYHQRPEVQRDQQQRQQQQRQPQVQQPQQQDQRPQRQMEHQQEQRGRQYQGESQRQQPHGRPEGEDGDHRR